jgi:acyl-coenzyme A synthetase/AMP-(fatty) acid ligase/3-hydroxymyristoyl/3-hydroxydecanoyl-(acyl carrier protein) dehydratase
MSDSDVDLFRVVASRADAHVVGWRDGAPVRNDDFMRRIAAWQALLQKTPGQHFALYLDDSVEFAAALLGAWRAAKTIWLTADTLPASCQALQQSVDGFLGDFPARWAPLKAGALENDGAHHDVAAMEAAMEADFIALVVHTSGTTGAAQAISKRWSQLAAEVATLESLFGARLGEAAIVATVSHQHIYGLLFKVLWPLASGRAIHARMQNFPEELLQLLADSTCALVASPAYLKRLPVHLPWSEVQANLQAVFSSGGPLPAEAAHAVGALLGCAPIEVYGSSETGGIAWRQRTGSSDDAWQPLPGVACRAAAEESLLEVRSPHLADDNWSRLADRVTFQQDGRFALQGRNDRIAKIEEKRISLDAIERTLQASSLVSEARVIVCDDGSSQRQRIAAFVVPSKEGQRVLAAEGKLAMNNRLRQVLADVVEPLALPRRWRYLERMPLNAQGKTTHALLLAALNERPREPAVRELVREADRVALEIVVPADLFYFDGHFSQAPILPGVVQVDWAIGKGREYFPLPDHFRAIHALKFQHVIQPDKPVTLELLHDAEKGSLNFRYFSPNAQHASGRILFRNDPHA